MLTLIVLILLALGINGLARGQIVRYRNCEVDAEMLAPPTCAYETKNGHLYLSQRYVALYFSSNRSRLAAIHLPNYGWAYINRKGRVVVQNVATYDNSASTFYHGLVRVTRGGKWGLANSDGAIVVPFKYDGMWEYQADSGWKVCTGCRVVFDSYREHSWFKGGDWLWLNSQGQVARRAKEDPTTP